jgi:ABC-type glutathione transport system ATPase component
VLTSAGEGDELTVVLLGKTGAGKSSLGNSLINAQKSDKQFKVGRGLTSETQICGYREKQINGIRVQVSFIPLPPDYYQSVCLSFLVSIRI